MVGGGGTCRSVLVAVAVCVAAGGVALVGVGAWAYAQLAEFTSMRNENHYRFDLELNWPQAAPWLFIAAGCATVPVALCGVCGALGRGRRALSLHATLLLALALAHAAVAAVVFLYVAGEPIEKFVEDAILDGIHNAKTNPDALKVFGRIERRLRCCGAKDLTDYRTWEELHRELPLSCCSRDALAAACPRTDHEANTRHGCVDIAALHARRLYSLLAAGAAAVGLLELVGLTAALAVLARRRSARPLPRDAPPDKTLVDGFK